MESMKVQPGQVSASASQLQSRSQSIRSHLDDLDSKVARLQASWDGEAKEAYRVAQSRWNQSISEIQQLLTRIAQKTDEMSGGYVQGDRRSASLFQ